ncbi:hypothetical protein SGLAM104S_03832 [Streptomyces glaucescens]
MNRWLGSGPSRKSSSSMAWNRTETGSGCASRYSRLVIPPTSASASSPAGQRLEGGPQVVGGQDAVLLLVEDPVQDQFPGRRDVQGLGQQVAEEVHLDAPVAQHVGEPVVLGARPAHPEHVVEEQGVLVAGGEALQLQVRSVQDDAAEPARLGVDMESHDSILTGETLLHASRSRAADGPARGARGGPAPATRGGPGAAGGRPAHDRGSTGSQPGVDRLRLQRQHAEDRLVHPPQRLAVREPVQRLQAEGVLAQRERTGLWFRNRLRSRARFSGRVYSGP